MGGPGLRPAHRRGRGLPKRVEAQGGRRGTPDTKCSVPDSCDGGTFITFQKILLISYPLMVRRVLENSKLLIMGYLVPVRRKNSVFSAFNAENVVAFAEIAC